MNRGLEDYRTVKQRLHDFRKEHPTWTIQTFLDLHDGHWLAQTHIRDEHGHPVANGHAYEKAQKPFDAEKAETSAVGRALVFAGWTDSLEMSQEETERAAPVSGTRRAALASGTRRADKGPVKAGDAAKPGRIKPPPAPEYQIDGDTEPPTPPRAPATVPRSYKQVAAAMPVQSASKAVWSDHIAALASAATYEDLDVDWLTMTGGKRFKNCTIDDLKNVAAIARDTA